MRKTTLLRQLLERSSPIVVAGAHDGLSAKLVQRAGFDAVWASGFAISASHGMPDANLLSMTEHLAVCKNINDNVSIPVLADCDNGYGNAINVIRMVEEYEKAGIAAICMEDSAFPKRCSFFSGVRRELTSVPEFVGKIRAAKKAQQDPDFVVIARTESLIVEEGLEQALVRGRAYADEGGADLFLIHSKDKSGREVREFVRAWDRSCPLVVVPTMFKETSVKELDAAGFKVIIFANQALRASIQAMARSLAILRREGAAAAVDSQIAPMEEVYELMGLRELQTREAEFLPARQAVVAVIVAAGLGFEQELMPLIEDRPKTMLDVRGKSILERQVETLQRCGIDRVVVVRGYKKERVDLPRITYYDNDRYAETDNLYSLFCAEPALAGRVLFLYGDILFDRSIVERLLESTGDVVLVVDHAWYDDRAQGVQHAVSRPELVATQSPPVHRRRFVPFSNGNRILKIGRTLGKDQAHAEFIGMALLSERGVALFRQTYHEVLQKFNGQPFHEAKTLEKATFGDMVQELIDRGQVVHALDIYKGWMEVDTFDDYRRVWAEIDRIS